MEESVHPAYLYFTISGQKELHKDQRHLAESNINVPGNLPPAVAGLVISSTVLIERC